MRDRHPKKQVEAAINEYTFTLMFLAPGETGDELAVRLYERVDDASLMGPDDDGLFACEFDRRAPSLPDALEAAVGQLRDALPEAVLLRVEEHDLATIVDIAARAGRTPESVRLLVNGRRGPGGFPPAAGRLGARTKVWRWVDVAEWFDHALRDPLPETADSAFLRSFNDALEIRRLASRLGERERQVVAFALRDQRAAAA